MATLEQRLRDTGYKYWMKAGLCLAFVKQGLERFADERSKRLHNYVKISLQNKPAFNKVCTGGKILFDKNNMKFTLNCCCHCEVYIEEFERFTSPSFKIKQGNWKNSNVQLWPNSPWEMAKIYMNEGQKSSQKNSTDTDLCGILNFIENCSLPKVDIQNVENVSKVRTAFTFSLRIELYWSEPPYYHFNPLRFERIKKISCQIKAVFFRYGVIMFAHGAD